MESALKIVIAQTNNSVGNIANNVIGIIQACQQAVKTHNADVILFPELALTGYPPEDLLLRPGFYRHVANGLQTIAQAITNIDVLLGYPENSATGLYNAMGWLHQGKWQATYRKQRLPNYSVFDEKRYFVSGDDDMVVTIAGIRVGLLICEDIWFEQPARKVAAAGAQVILVANASPFHLGKNIERERVIAQRAKDVELPIVYCHCVGGQDDLVFDGGSMVVNATGNICVHSGYFVESLTPVVLGLKDDELHPTPQPIGTVPDDDYLLYHALVTAVRDYVHKNGFSDVLLGLSGGIDSAVTLAIAVAAVGGEHVHALAMPSRYNAPMSIEDAKIQADKLKVKLSEISIEPAFSALLTSLQPEFAGLAEDITEENLQARIRGSILMALANKTNKMVLCTSNKSEMAVGFSTLYGDMVGGYCVLKDVLKTRVYRLAEYINNIFPEEVIPARVIARHPSAELSTGQKDADRLPDYAVLDRIIQAYVEQDMGPEDIITAGNDRDTVIKVLNMIDNSEYKRRQAPPGVRITNRAFGRERRYPITSGYGTWRGEQPTE